MELGRYRVPPKFPAEHVAHRDFTFSRVMYDSDRREPGGQGWYTDYPTADRNLMIRLSELTTTSVGFDEREEPDHVVVQFDDEQLFNYPFIFMSDVGTLRLSVGDEQRLREYLLKGGFLWVDDFWGPVCLGSMGRRDSQGPASRGIPHLRHPAGPSDPSGDVRGHGGATGPLHPALAAEWGLKHV